MQLHQVRYVFITNHVLLLTKMVNNPYIYTADSTKRKMFFFSNLWILHQRLTHYKRISFSFIRITHFRTILIILGFSIVLIIDQFVRTNKNSIYLFILHNISRLIPKHIHTFRLRKEKNVKWKHHMQEKGKKVMKHFIEGKSN